MHPFRRFYYWLETHGFIKTTITHGSGNVFYDLGLVDDVNDISKFKPEFEQQIERHLRGEEELVDFDEAMKALGLDIAEVMELEDLITIQYARATVTEKITLEELERHLKSKLPLEYGLKGALEIYGKRLAVVLSITAISAALGMILYLILID